MKRDFDAFGFGVKFGCGGLLGLVLGFCLAVRLFFTATSTIIFYSVGGFFIGGLLTVLLSKRL